MLTHRHHGEPSQASAPETRGRLINWARRYDLLVWLVTLGREQTLRRMTADLAHLQSGEAVLDVGCGTGTLTMVAKQRVGQAGRVCGVDPSVEMVAHARRKAARRGLAIDFQVGVIEQLAFPDQSFDVVLSSLMMHHLPDDLKRRGLAEIARVLKPGGRLLALDAKRPAGPWQSGIQDQSALMRTAGFSQIETGQTRFLGLGFALGRIGRAADGGAAV